jgi:hypothetical protein
MEVDRSEALRAALGQIRAKVGELESRMYAAKGRFPRSTAHDYAQGWRDALHFVEFGKLPEADR